MSKTYEDFVAEAQQYGSIIAKYQRTKEVFVDPNFHPQANIKEYRYRFSPRSHQWKRIDQYYKAPLFKPELIDSDFIKQGELGDCYFLSALSRIARQPELVEKLFDDQVNDILGVEENSINIKCGAVVIFFHAFGRRTPVLIDTQIPFKRGTRTPRFSHPTDLNVSPWFCLVEKAFAKLNGSYESIDGGSFPHAIYSLFGYFPDMKWISKLKDPAKMLKKTPFERLMKYQHQGSVMDAAIAKIQLPKSITEDTLLDLGLCLGHSYVIMKVRKYNDINLICLRNPWGEHEWLGDWSDTSDLWTEELKAALGMKESEDGSFWMNDKDFFYYFNKIDIAKPIPPEFHSRSFCVQLTPGPHDGAQVSSPEANVVNRTNYAFQITEPIRKGEKCKVYIVVERRHQMIDERTQKHVTPTQFCILVLNVHGQKISPEEYKHSGDGQLQRSATDIHGFCQVVRANRHIYTIFLQRTQKSNYTEDCYVQLFCKYDFKLYDIDYPDQLVLESETEGVMFDNNSVLHPNIALPLMKKKFGNKIVNTFDNEMKTIPPPPKELTPPDSESGSDDEEIVVTKEELDQAKAKAEEEAKAKQKAEEEAKQAMEEVERLQKMMKEMELKIAEHEKKLKEEKEKLKSDKSKEIELEKELELEKTLLATNKNNIRISKKNAKNLQHKAQKKKDESEEANLLSSFLLQSFRPGAPKPKKSKLKHKKSIKEFEFISFAEPYELSIDEQIQLDDIDTKDLKFTADELKDTIVDDVIHVNDYDDTEDDSEKEDQKNVNKGILLVSASSDDDDKSDTDEKCKGSDLLSCSSSSPSGSDDESPVKTKEIKKIDVDKTVKEFSKSEEQSETATKPRKKSKGIRSYRPKITPI